MDESILITIRELIGPSASYEVFNADLIMDINAAFSRLCQLGVGPRTPFRIESDTETWGDFMDGNEQVADVKQYVFLKTKMLFDPPANATVTKIYQEQIDMLEWTMKEVARFGY